MKIEKGKLYYDTKTGQLFIAPNYGGTAREGITNKIAVNCPTKEDWEYVRSKGYTLTKSFYESSDYGLYSGTYRCQKGAYHIITIDDFRKFYPDKTPERFYTNTTPRLIELHKNYKGAKDTLRSYDNISFFDNCNSFNGTGHFGATNIIGQEHYTLFHYTEVTEEEFIKLMELEDLDKELFPKKIKQAKESLKDVTLPITNEAIKFEDGKLTWEVDFEFLEGIAKRMEVSSKYPPYNWQKPLDHKKLLTAGFRHYVQIMKGDFEDDGQEYGHLFAVATNLMMAYYQLKYNKNS